MSEFIGCDRSGEASRFQESGVTAGVARPIVPPQKGGEMAVRVDQFMCRSDNFGVLVHDDKAAARCWSTRPRKRRSSRPSSAPAGSRTCLLITHHHGDHVEANLALKKKFGLTIIGPGARSGENPGHRPDGREGDTIPFGRETISVHRDAGHTAGHVSYLFPDSGTCFAGRHAVCARLRPAARMQAAGDVRVVARSCRRCRWKPRSIAATNTRRPTPALR